MEAKRTDAKNLFKAVSEGKRVALTNVQMADKSTVRFDLSMDHSEYDGTLNFGAFRSSLMMLLSNLAGAVKEQAKIPTFGAEGNPDNIIFGVTGVSIEKDVPSVLVLSTSTAGQDASVMLRLMYLNYQQFVASQQSEDE